MKIGLFIIARLGSTRLPDKHLMSICGATCLEIMYGKALQVAEKLHRSLLAECSIFVVTSENSENDRMEKVCGQLAMNCFRGHDANIPVRILQAANHLGVDVIVPLDGDDLLLSELSLATVSGALVAGHDVVRSSGLPLGMNAWGFSAGALKTSLELNEIFDTPVLETGWGAIFPEGSETLITVSIEGSARIRATLDYAEDLNFFRAVFSELGESSLADHQLVQLILDKGFYKINQSRANEYAENFARRRFEWLR